LGADEPLLSPVSFCGITKKTARRAIDLWAQSKARMAWKHTPGQRHAKKIINKPSNKLILILSRNQMRLVVGLLTGHCHLRKHLHRLGIYKDKPVCRKCCMGE
jgi:hypothetical protein